jgi:hypothetical protein
VVAKSRIEPKQFADPSLVQDEILWFNFFRGHRIFTNAFVGKLRGLNFEWHQKRFSGMTEKEIEWSGFYPSKSLIKPI